MGMESMAMPGMIGMPCTKTVPIDLSAWTSGKARLMLMLANNDHMPTAGAVPSVIDVVVKLERRGPGGSYIDGVGEHPTPSLRMGAVVPAKS